MTAQFREILSFDDLLMLAERESGAYCLADEALLVRVRGMVERFNSRGPYAPWQIAGMQKQLLRMLSGRLRILLDRQRFPQIAEEVISRPVFIVGFPRSGTTLLHSLLAENPDMLKIQSWHLLSPSPPPGAGAVCQQRIAEAQRRIEDWMDFCPAQRLMHPYIDKGAYQLCENEEAFSLDFHNAYPFYYYDVPTLEPADVLPSAGPEPYQGLKELMQHLQWNTGKTRWVCKEPGAQMRLAEIFTVFPDALCVWAHRPMAEIYASNVALRAATYDTIAGQPRDWTSQPKTMAQKMKNAFDELLTSELIRDPRIIHLPFRELTSDPMGVIRRICEKSDIEINAGFEANVTAWLANPENAVDRYGRYPYSYEAFGLERAWVEDLFADYSRYFGLD